MNSFVRHIERQKFRKLAETAFTLMAARGLNPMRFVEWYTQEGILLSEHEILSETRYWLLGEMRLSEVQQPYSGEPGPQDASPWSSTIGGALRGVVPGMANNAGDSTMSKVAGWIPGVSAIKGAVSGYQNNQQATADHNSKAQNNASVPQALQALDNFSRYMSPELAQNSQLVQSLHYLISAMRSTSGQFRSQPPPLPTQQPQQPQQQPQQPVQAPTVPPAPATAPQVAWNRPEGPFLAEMKVRRVCNMLSEHGIDPRRFVRWYAEEGRYLKGQEFKESFGNWISQVGAGISSMFGGQGFSHGYNQKKKGFQDQAAAQALHALGELKKHAQQTNLGGPEFMKHIDVVLQGIDLSIKQSQQAQAQQGGEQAGQQGPDMNKMMTALAAKHGGNPNEWSQEFDKISKTLPTFQQEMQGIDTPEKLEAKIAEWKQKGVWNAVVGPGAMQTSGDNTQVMAGNQVVAPELAGGNTQMTGVTGGDANSASTAGVGLDNSFDPNAVGAERMYMDKDPNYNFDPQAKQLVQDMRSQGKTDDEIHRALAAHMAQKQRANAGAAATGSIDAGAGPGGSVFSTTGENYRPRSRRRSSEDDVFMESLRNQMSRQPKQRKGNSWFM